MRLGSERARRRPRTLAASIGAVLVGIVTGACSSSPSGPAGSSGVSTGASAGASAASGVTAGSPTSGSTSPASGSTLPSSGSIAASGASGAVSTGSSTGAASTGAATGTSAGNGTSAGASGQASGASSGVADASMYPPIANGGPCPPNALYCDNFEEYSISADAGPLDLTEMAPSWLQFSFHGYPRVDNAMPYAGKQSAHFDTEAGSYRFAAFIRQTPDGTPVVPLAHFGRVMVNFNKVSPTSQWTFLEAGGLLPGSTTEMATFGFGGNNGHLAASYTQRPRIVTNGMVPLRPGGPENDMENSKAALACTKTATTETFPAMKWVCVEWNIDATTGTMHLWLDGVAQTEIDVSGEGTECSIGAPTTAWAAPTAFTKFDLTWEGYGGDSPGQQSYYDEFAVGEQRIGCPAAP